MGPGAGALRWCGSERGGCGRGGDFWHGIQLLLLPRRLIAAAAAAVGLVLWLGLGLGLGLELVVEDCFGEGAVGVGLDGLPLPVEEPEEALEHGSGLLPAEPQLLHGGQRQPRLLLVAPHHLSSSVLLPPSVRHDSIGLDWIRFTAPLLLG